MNQTFKLLPKAIIRLKIFATKAAPSPALGQSLGQYGINIMDFCKKFNNQTRNLKEEVLVSVIVKIFSQKNYDIEIKTPSSSYFLKKISSMTYTPDILFYSQNSQDYKEEPDSPNSQKELLLSDESSLITRRSNESNRPKVTLKEFKESIEGKSFLFLKEIYHLAIFKKCDTLIHHLKVKSICKTLIGTAKSMNIAIIDWPYSRDK